MPARMRPKNKQMGLMSESVRKFVFSQDDAKCCCQVYVYLFILLIKVIIYLKRKLDRILLDCWKKLKNEKKDMIWHNTVYRPSVDLFSKYQPPKTHFGQPLI